MDEAAPSKAPAFSQAFQADFEDLLRWRRDVRRFRPDPIPEEDLGALLKLADMAPSVGNSQPWRIVDVRDPERRGQIKAVFENENAKALSGYEGEEAKLYKSLKLEGLDRAPVQVAVFCEPDPAQGKGLGRQSMPETLAYSCVAMIQTLWLAARLKGVGLGWVSILTAARLNSICNVPEDWRFIAYLCLGYPEEELDYPELERAGWQNRTPLSSRVFCR